MSDLFTRLAAAAVGQSTSLRPRLRGRFEPPAGAAPATFDVAMQPAAGAERQADSSLESGQLAELWPGAAPNPALRQRTGSDPAQPMRAAPIETEPSIARDPNPQLRARTPATAVAPGAAPQSVTARGSELPGRAGASPTPTPALPELEATAPPQAAPSARPRAIPAAPPAAETILSSRAEATAAWSDVPAQSAAASPQPETARSLESEPFRPAAGGQLVRPPGWLASPPPGPAVQRRPEAAVPAIQVRIGRVEIRVPATPPPEPPRLKSQPQKDSLEDYLRRPKGVRR